jgi:hypothetical protein
LGYEWKTRFNVAKLKTKHYAYLNKYSFEHGECEFFAKISSSEETGNHDTFYFKIGLFEKQEWVKLNDDMSCQEKLNKAEHVLELRYHFSGLAVEG